jgi:pimeloyl-ACP methyl ester carboxylesterase
MSFSDLPSPAEASSRTERNANGFAQAGNRRPLFRDMHHHNTTQGGVSMTRSVRTCALVAFAVAGAVAVAQPGLAQNLKYKPISVKTPDGLTISAQEWGNPNGPEILFIHGFSQSHMSWMRQVEGDLAKQFRMITYDLRGHGNSDKPLEPEKYKESKAWADELQAVIDVAKLKRPVLVGWSYGGRVIADYLRIRGAGNLAGLHYVDAVSKSDPSFFGDGLKVQPQMLSEDLATNIAATRTFLHNCFEKQPTQEEFETMLAFNMMVPPKVRANMGGRTLSMDDTLKALKLPVLVTQGAADRLVLPAAAKHTAETIPGAKLSIHDGIGHAPFWEDTARFNAELAAFVRAANKTN